MPVVVSMLITLRLFGFQGALTSGYIILLSRVGERVAADMRKALFSSLLR